MFLCNNFLLDRGPNTKSSKEVQHAVQKVQMDLFFSPELPSCVLLASPDVLLRTLRGYDSRISECVIVMIIESTQRIVSVTFCS